MCLKNIRNFKNNVFDKWSTTTKISIIIIGVVLPLGLFFWNEYSSQQKHQEIINLTEKQHETMINECFKTIKNLTGFRDFVCNDVNATTKCLNYPEEANGSLLINECDSIYLAASDFSGYGYIVTTMFKPLWNADGKVHYLIDIVKDLESNRISLFTENNMLKLRIYQSNGIDTTIKTGIENWNNEEWYLIEIKWFKISGNVFLNVNYNEIGLILEDMQIDLKDSKLFLGSESRGTNQADGYFDFIAIDKYTYPEPTVTLGPEISV